MLQTLLSNTDQTLPNFSNDSPGAPEATGNPPPVVVPLKNGLHPIFGNIPIGKDGCALAGQPIEWLNHCHKKASKLLEPWNRPGDISDEDDQKYEAINAIRWDIFRAATETELNSASRCATFLELSYRHYREHEGSDCADFVVKGQWLAKITADLKAATAFPRPTKRIGALSKGKKLTRAGLMLRYHAFLIGELNTLGIAFYGCREYPERMIPMDDAVNVRARSGFRNGKYDEKQNRRKRYPFFDESKLTDRAKSVLKSLKIDITTADKR